MIKLLNDGGSAFPVPPDGGFIDGDEGFKLLTASPGMSLRDWFAGKAMNGMIIGTVGNMEVAERLVEICKDKGLTDQAYISKCAYEYADAMLAAREVKQ